MQMHAQAGQLIFVNLITFLNCRYKDIFLQLSEKGLQDSFIIKCLFILYLFLFQLYVCRKSTLINCPLIQLFIIKFALKVPLPYLITMTKRPPNFDIKIAEQIIDEAIMESKPHFLIKWKDLPHENDTWESIDNLENIVEMIQNWIRTKRPEKADHNYAHASSYCDTVNNINPLKKPRRKRKIIQKSRPSQKTKNKSEFLVVLDVENDLFEQSKRNLIQQESDIGQCQESQYYSKIEEVSQKQKLVETQSTCKVQTRSKKIAEECTQITPKWAFPVRFQPENSDPARQITSESSNDLKSGMKVIGRVRSQDIENIFEHFTFKQTICFKIELKDGRITNMRQQDLKRICPQMLMQYFEDKGIKI